MSNSSNRKKNKSKKNAGIKIDTLPNEQVEVQSNEENTSSNEENTASNEELSSSNEEEIIIEITPPQELVIEEDTTTDVTNANLSFKKILNDVGDELKDEAIVQTNNLLYGIRNDIVDDNISPSSSNINLEKTVETVIADIGKELIRAAVEEIKEEIAELKEEAKEIVQKVSTSARMRIALLRNRR